MSPTRISEDQIDPNMATEQETSSLIASTIANYYTKTEVDNIQFNLGNSSFVDPYSSSASNKELHVNFNYTGTSTGSYEKPFKTVQEAVDAATSMQTIYLHSGSNSTFENVTIGGSKVNITIEGVGCEDSHATVFNGTITLSGTSTRIRLKNFQINSSAQAGLVPLTITATDGRHVFENVSLVASSANGTVLSWTNPKNWLTLRRCAPSGKIVLSGTPTLGSVFTMSDNNDYGTVIDQQCSVSVQIIRGVLKQARHTAGFMGISGLMSANGASSADPSLSGTVGVVSSANLSASNVLFLHNSMFINTSLVQTSITKTGTCAYYLENVLRNTTGESLTGSKVSFLGGSAGLGSDGKLLSAQMPAIAYDIMSQANGLLTASHHLLNLIATRAFTLPQNLTGSFCKAQTAANSSTTFIIYKNASSIGTVTFSALSTDGVIDLPLAISFSPGDVLRVVGPGTPDNTLSDVAISLKVEV